MARANTEEKMREMRFYGMAEAYRANLETSNASDFTKDELIDYLIDSEWNERERRRIKRRVTSAKFRYPASVENIDYGAGRNLDKNSIVRLSDCSFIKRRENIIITGPTGVGKSYLSSAIGNQACLLNYKVLYYNISKLFSNLKISKIEGRYIREVRKIENQDLLILDDYGLTGFDTEKRTALLEIIEDRHDKHSTIITSQLPVVKWHEIIGDSTIADAIMDRLVHSSHRIELAGGSMRKKL